MNIKSTIAIALFASAGVALNAQSLDTPPVKILPAAQAGFVKLLYAMEINDPVEVKFYANGELLYSEVIKGNYAQGISKKYDIRRLSGKDFWVEVSSPAMSVTYKVSQTGDMKRFLPQLTKTTYNHLLVASKR